MPSHTHLLSEESARWTLQLRMTVVSNCRGERGGEGGGVGE